MDRLIAFLYGLACYVIFFFTMLYAVGFVSGVAVPKTIDTGASVPTVEASTVDLLLIFVFAIQHSVMARRHFKQWWTKFVPAAVERSTYVLFSSLILALLFWQWRPMPAQVWQIADPQIAAAVTGLSIFGWMIARASTFLVNHFELFGLHQVGANLIGREAPAQRFHAPVLYKMVRHPTYLGLTIAFWVAPTMTIGHLLFAAATTAYIFVGIVFEERDLVEVFGENYRSYRDRVSMLVPWSRPEQVAPSQIIDPTQRTTPGSIIMKCLRNVQDKKKAGIPQQEFTEDQFLSNSLRSRRGLPSFKFSCAGPKTPNSSAVSSGICGDQLAL